MDIMTIISNAAGELIAPTTAAYVLAAIGLNIHFGMTGLMNMGQAGFMLLGAYGFAITQSLGCNLCASVCAALARAGIPRRYWAAEADRPEFAEYIAWIGNTYLDDSGRDSPASLNSTGDM